MSQPTRNKFWSALRVYIEKPHVVNRKLCGYQILAMGYQPIPVHTSSVHSNLPLPNGEPEQICIKELGSNKSVFQEICSCNGCVEMLTEDQMSCITQDIVFKPNETIIIDENTPLQDNGILGSTTAEPLQDDRMISTDSIEPLTGNRLVDTATVRRLDNNELIKNAVIIDDHEGVNEYDLDSRNNCYTMATDSYSNHHSFDKVSRSEPELSPLVSDIADILHEKILYQTNGTKLDRILSRLSSNAFDMDSFGNAKDIPWERILESKQNIAIIRKMIPKSIRKSLLEILFLDGSNDTVTFMSESCGGPPKYLPEVSYVFGIVGETMDICILSDLPPNPPSNRWLQKVLLPRILKWFKQTEPITRTQCSLSLVDIEYYNEIYQTLKNKYAKVLIEMWTESTDPLKFIYEDIAIAAYLIAIWEDEKRTYSSMQLKPTVDIDPERKQLRDCSNRDTENIFKPVLKQSFVDIGCGNGLLVYILSSEGYRGLGIDIAKRKIWDAYPDYVDLRVESVIPSEPFKYPEYQWLIGNHSDELTPWLPVLATKAGPSNCYFVIPCCAHDFFNKFQRRKSGLSQYAEYLDYVEHIGSICGFDVQKDKLRIPSTKRMCYVGQKRTYVESSRESILNKINKFINDRATLIVSDSNAAEELSHRKNYSMGAVGSLPSVSEDKLYPSSELTNSDMDINNKYKKELDILSDPIQNNIYKEVKDNPNNNSKNGSVTAVYKYSKDFIVREANQRSRNCTQLSDDVRNDLVDTVASFLLAKENSVEIETSTGFTSWNKGGSLLIPQIVAMLSEDQKGSLRKECGGLQTLLRNHHHVFLVQNGNVSLKEPQSALQKNVPKDRIKQKSCWFFAKHPQGCTLSDGLCTFLH